LRSECVAFLAAVAVLAAASPARAQATAARLDVDAQPSCSTRDELVARVAARSARIRFVADGAGVPALSARIDVAPRGGVVAELTVVEPDGRRFVRRLEAPSCAAATDALALVVAITLDPTVVAADGTGANAAGTNATGGSASGGNTTGAPGATAAPESTPAVTPATAAPPPEAAEETGSRARAPAGATSGVFTWRFGAGVNATVVAGPAPRVMPGAGVEALAGLDGASIWSPALVLSFAHAWSGAWKSAGGTAEFTMDLAALDACPLRIVVLHVEARACAAGALGRLTAQGSNTFDARSAARPFAAVGGAARLTVPIGSVMEVRARFVAAAPLWRDAFEFNPQVFHRVASVTLVGELGLGARFP